jgi:hypothetical protein
MQGYYLLGARFAGGASFFVHPAETKAKSLPQTAGIFAEIGSRNGANFTAGRCAFTLDFPRLAVQNFRISRWISAPF